MTPAQLLAVMPNAGSRVEHYALHLSRACVEFGISNALRKAAFIAQVAHESGELRYVRELGSDAYLDKYDTGPLAEKLGNTPQDDDDGQVYRGRGLLQITGRRNYQACGEGLGLPLLAQPWLLETPIQAARSAAWFWYSRGLNDLADQERFGTITKIVNGGFNGLDERIRYYVAARRAFG